MTDEEQQIDENAVRQAVVLLKAICQRLKELSEEAAELCRDPLDEDLTIH